MSSVDVHYIKPSSAESTVLLHDVMQLSEQHRPGQQARRVMPTAPAPRETDVLPVSTDRFFLGVQMLFPFIVTSLLI